MYSKDAVIALLMFSCAFTFGFMVRPGKRSAKIDEANRANMIEALLDIYKIQDKEGFKRSQSSCNIIEDFSVAQLFKKIVTLYKLSRSDEVAKFEDVHIKALRTFLAYCRLVELKKKEAIDGRKVKLLRDLLIAYKKSLMFKKNIGNDELLKIILEVYKKNLVKEVRTNSLMEEGQYKV